MEQSTLQEMNEHTVNQVKYTVTSQFKAQTECAENLVDKVKRLILNDTKNLEDM